MKHEIGTIKTEGDKNNFKVHFEHYKEVCIEPALSMGFDRYILLANGFVIATFSSVNDLKGFMQYIKSQGNIYINSLPKPIYEILKHQAYKTHPMDNFNNLKNG